MLKEQSHRSFSKLAEESTREKIHFGLLIVVALSLSFIPVDFTQTSLGLQLAEDKTLHYDGGDWIASLVFHVGYIALAVKMLLYSERPMILRLIWLPTAFFFLGSFALLIVSVIAGGKEALDALGMGTSDWEDFIATVDGGFMPNVHAVLLLLGFTPALIALDLLLQWPEKALRDNSTGHEEMDAYLNLEKDNNDKSASVLLIEDDLSCATLAMKFCKKAGLQCRHVDTLKDAMRAFVDIYPQLQVVILDLFVRVEDANDRRTGADWLNKVNQKFPKGKRKFLVVITTGHPEQLGDKAELADMVLAKPWDPQQFKDFLTQHQIIKTKAP